MCNQFTSQTAAIARINIHLLTTNVLATDVEEEGVVGRNKIFHFSTLNRFLFPLLIALNAFTTRAHSGNSYTTCKKVTREGFN
jgi:hypothetical protein